MVHFVCHVVRRDSSAIKFDRVEIAFILALFYWLKQLIIIIIIIMSVFLERFSM